MSASFKSEDNDRAHLGFCQVEHFPSVITTTKASCVTQKAFSSIDHHYKTAKKKKEKKKVDYVFSNITFWSMDVLYLQTLNHDKKDSKKVFHITTV